MRYIIYGKNLEVSEGLKQAVHDKFSKLEVFHSRDRSSGHIKRAEG